MAKGLAEITRIVNRRDWSVRIATRYALLHVPGLILLILILPSVQRWTELPPWFFWGFVLLWIVKDMVLFPFVWRAYDWSCPMHVHALVGTEGIAQERLAPSGYIRVHGELWKAEVIRDGPPIEKGGVARIQGIRGLVLLVQQRSKVGALQNNQDNSPHLHEPHRFGKLTR
jgi:membrane protein implicated in regulation of membrane protease activity